MVTRIVQREDFYICGYSAETTLEHNDEVMSTFFSDFFSKSCDKALEQIPPSLEGYYGLDWYTPGRKSFFYLLGRAVAENTAIPEGAQLKHIPAAQYMVVSLPAGANMVEAWTEFFFKAIPESGYTVDDQHGYYFEYYPSDYSEPCELWSPIK